MKYDIADLVGLLFAGLAGGLVISPGAHDWTHPLIGQAVFISLDWLGRRAIDYFTR